MIWLITGTLISFLTFLRLRTVASGEPLATCARCGYDLQGLDTAALCPECGGAERVLPIRRRQLGLVPSWPSAAMVWLAMATVMAVHKGAQVVGAWVNYCAFEPSAAAWSNARLGLWEALTSPNAYAFSSGMLALATIWWRPRYAIIFLVAGLVLVAQAGYQEAILSPAAVRVGTFRATPEYGAALLTAAASGAVRTAIAGIFGVLRLLHGANPPEPIRPPANPPPAPPYP